MKSFVISPITQTQIDSLVLNLKDHGSIVQSDPTEGYQISGHGIQAMAKFDGSSLIVVVIHKPFFVSMDMIENGLKSSLT